MLKLIELRTGVAQARDPHDGGFTNMQFCPGWKLQQIHPSRRDVFTELPWRDGETLCSQFFKEFGVEQVDLAQVGL